MAKTMWWCHASFAEPKERASTKPCMPTCDGQRHITTSHYAYIKISEGCDRNCAYCAIPIMTGKHRSRPMDEILDEVNGLVTKGIHEFQVIAQELTYYGIDVDGKQHIAELVSRMADIKGVRWIRLHYAYPAHFPWELLDVIREKPNVCNYLDIALQHISDHMLERMHRHLTSPDNDTVADDTHLVFIVDLAFSNHTQATIPSHIIAP